MLKKLRTKPVAPLEIKYESMSYIIFSPRCCISSRLSATSSKNGKDLMQYCRAYCIVEHLFFSTVRVVRDWNTLPREAVSAPSLEVCDYCQAGQSFEQYALVKDVPAQGRVLGLGDV